MSELRVFISLLASLVLGAVVLAQPGSAQEGAKRPLPDLYPYVAADILDWSGSKPGIWLDLGAGDGGVGLAVACSENAAAATSTLVLLDPNAEALCRAQQKGREKGLGSRLVAVVGVAEKIPFPDSSIDLIFSRGSIYFWQDPVQGIREIHRVLRPGGKAMIGGGLGSQYPEWARREAMRRRHGGSKADSPQAKEFARLRDPATFRQWATDAGLKDFEVSGQGALSADDPHAGVGIWLKFTKPESR